MVLKNFCLSLFFANLLHCTILKKEFPALESEISSLQLFFCSEFCSKSEQNSAATASITPATNQTNYGTKKLLPFPFFLQTYFIVYLKKEFPALESEISCFQLLFWSEFCSKSEQNSATTASTTPATNQSNDGTEKKLLTFPFFNKHSFYVKKKKGFLQAKSKIEFDIKKYKVHPTV